MALPSPQGLYRLNVIGEIHGQLTNNLFHFRGGVNANMNTHANELGNIMSDFITHVIPKLRAFANDDWKVKTVLGVSLIPRPGVLIETRIASGDGLQLNDSLPSFCAGLLSFRSGFGGRSGGGRLYIPGVAEDRSEDSRLEGTYLTLLNDIGSTLLTRYGLSGTAFIARFGTFSRVLGVTRNPGPPVSLTYNMNGFFPSTSFIARSEIVTQRKRMLFRGQ